MSQSENCSTVLSSQTSPEIQTATEVGYDQRLFLVPLDSIHFNPDFKLLSLAPARNFQALPSDTKQLLEEMILSGLVMAVRSGIPSHFTGILSDGTRSSDQMRGTPSREILEKAKFAHFVTALPVEKPGQDEFELASVPELQEQIQHFAPTFLHAPIQFNPEGNLELNSRELARLKKLSTACRLKGYRLLIELHVPPTMYQLGKVYGNPARFDSELRPGLSRLAIQELQDSGIEADVWAVEPVEKEADCRALVDQARSGESRKKVGILLSSESSEVTGLSGLSRVRRIYENLCDIPGVLGFISSKALYEEALAGFLSGILTRERAETKIGENFRKLCEPWCNLNLDSLETESGSKSA